MDPTEEILKKLEAIEQRIAAVENRFEAGQSPQVHSEKSAPPPPQYRPDTNEKKQQWWEIPSAQKVLSEKLSIPRADSNVESYIGRWILGIVGIIAILFGVAFFLKYAFDNNFIGPAGRVFLGIVGGTAFVLLGEYFRSRIAKYSYILSGGGLALFYLSIYSAFQYYHLINQTTAFGFMIMVTLFGVALSIWADAMELAGLAVFGGFITPFLLSTGVANDLSFFTYLGILNLGILAVSLYKKWHPLILLGFVLTVINFGSWYGSYYESKKLFLAIYVLAVYFLIYLLAGLFANITSRKEADSADLFIFTINPAWFFGWCYFLLKPQYQDSLGFLAAGLGALYILFAYLASTMSEKDKRLAMFLGAIAVVFITIAVPLELEQSAITIAWAVEAAVLYILGLLLANQGMRVFGLAVFILSVLRLNFESVDLNNFIPLFNRRFFTYLMVIISSAVMTYASVRLSTALSRFEKGTQTFLGAAATLLIFIAISIEISAFFDAQIVRLNKKYEREQGRALQFQNRPGIFPNQPYALDSQSYERQSAEHRSLNNQRNASISVFWALYAIGLIVAGVVMSVAALRWTGLALFALTIFKVFIFDLAALRTPYRIISFLCLGIVLLIASWLYFKYQKILESKSI